MFKEVLEFEQKVADFYGAPYGVATDCCTHAIELALRLQKPEMVTIPKQTYISIPFTLIKLGIEWKWDDVYWSDYYTLGNTNIIDSAVYWKENSYVSGSLMCLSFQHKKHLSVGRGGMILTDDVESYRALKKMSHDGRDPTSAKPWAEQPTDTIGFHYYMTPETANLGLERLREAILDTDPRKWSYKDYPVLTEFPVFKNGVSL